ncbi:MAG: transaldolase [Syntrophorhabdaceae bacterium]|nr:transaldolase [Syntrophorhabdaceae bacterium]
MTKNPLVALGDAGQSVWLDYIHREIIDSGGLARLIVEDGLRGVTSNPTIFEKAISLGAAYDDLIRSFAREKITPKQAYQRIVIRDIRDAADILRLVYDSTEGADGYVSLEVEPDIANDAQATVDRALELFSLVARPNVMIKIPATPEGLPAIEDAIALGIPVNATLIFSVNRYAEVLESYLRGMERLLFDGGDPKTVASVASFFVSRVDTAVDALLKSEIQRSSGSEKAGKALALTGKLAAANARAAYAKFLEVISTERWKRLAVCGARKQRLLWASTGTKNKEYSDVKYVEELIGPDTVNTMPPETMDAFRDHGKVADALSDSCLAAKSVIESCSLMDISIEEVCKRLEHDGVKSFLDSYQTLLAAIEKKLAVFGGGMA